MRIRKLLLLVAVISICLIVAIFSFRTTDTAKAQNVYKLLAPEFITQAQPNSIDSYIGDKLDAEAGISAYYKTPDAITLSQVRGVFRTIEAETANYIIGSVAVPNFPEKYDVHVYVNTNGWILSYYLRADNVSKIVDIYHQTINTTNFTTVIATVAAAAGAPFTEASYYDFRYPNATNMIFIAEDYEDGNDFTIQLPSSYAYFERGFAVWYFRVVLDGVGLPPDYDSGNYHYGTISAGQLLPAVTHTVEVDHYGVLCITYRVP